MVFWGTERMDGMSGCRKVTCLGKATCRLPKAHGALLLPATFLAVDLLAVWVCSCFPLPRVCLDSIAFLVECHIMGGYIAFSDGELVPPSGIVSHQRNLHCRIQQICVFPCITSLEMLFFRHVPISWTS